MKPGLRSIRSVGLLLGERLSFSGSFVGGDAGGVLPPFGPAGRRRLHPEQIPQRLPLSLYERNFAAVTPRDERITRRVVPIILRALADKSSWRQAASGLDLVPLATSATVSNWLDAARATDSLDQLLDRLRATAQHCATGTPIDYAARRRMCRRLNVWMTVGGAKSARAQDSARDETL